MRREEGYRNPILRKIASKLSLICDLAALLISTRNRTNALRLKVRFRNSRIRRLREMTYSNLDNIHVGDNVLMHGDCVLRIHDSCRLFIGEGTHVGYCCHIAGTQGNIVIGRDVLIADRVFISSVNYEYENIAKPVKKLVSKGDVIIGDECWIGIGSSILSGVRIGKHSIVGANSVVTHDIPPYSVAVGSPARVIKKYSHAEKRWVRVEKPR